MCGIVGLHLKNDKLQANLGVLTTLMLEEMTDRGRDSSGVGIYHDPMADGFRYSLRAPDTGYSWEGLLAGLGELGESPQVTTYHRDAVVMMPGGDAPVLDFLAESFPEVNLVSWGRALEVFKDTGTPDEICARYGIADRTGYQAVGHTRMATESAVTTEHSHPFSPAADFTLVHNGSFSNYFSVRRDLEQQGVEFITDNDSEVAARQITFELATGADLENAIRGMMKVMDGFYTLLVATAGQFAVVRDAFVCKPAMVAETDDYVAMSSEYRALARLPGIADAEVFEPQAEEVLVWSR